MIRNVFQKTMSLVALMGLLLNPASLAANLFRPIPATPYDSRLLGAGMFEAVPFTLVQSDSIESLFAQARSFRYVSDGKIDHWQSPAETEQRRSGDCEDKALWLFDRLRRSGYDGVLLVIGKKSARDRGLHVWVEYKDSNGAERLLDPTAARKIWNVQDFDPNTYRRIYSFDGQAKYRYETPVS